MVSSSCWCKDSFSWEPTAGEAGEPDFVVLSRKWANGGMGWMLIATVWIGSFPHSLLTRKQIAWKAENWEAWSATYDFSSLKPVLSFTTSRGSRNDMAKEKTQTAALGVQTYMFATPIRACFLQPSNYIIHIIHLILYIPVYPKHVRGGSRCFKTRWWLHKRRKNISDNWAAQTKDMLPLPQFLHLLVSPWVEGVYTPAQPGGASQLLNGS